MKPLQHDDAHSVSAEMTAALGLMIRRVRRLILLRGLSLVILAWLAGLAVAMAIDGYWVIYSTWARWCVALVAYGPAAVVMVWTLLRPLSQTLTPAGLARAIERRHPELHERVSSAVELMATVDAPDQRGSGALIRALADTAAEDIRRVDPRVEISIRKVARYLALSTAALLAIVIAGLIWPTTAGRLALRSALPILNLPNIHAGDLAVEPGDTVALLGDRMRIVLRSTRAGLSDAQIILEQPDNRRQSLPMSRIAGRDGEGARFSAVTEPVSEGFVYRIRAGGAVTRAYNVTVTPRPQVTHLDVTYEYPSYTEREPTRTRVVQGDIRAVAGTHITVRAAFNKPVETVTLRLDGQDVSNEGDPRVSIRQPEPDAAVFRMQLEPGIQSTWKLEGVDAHGFTGGTGEYMIQAVADAVPNVVITHPTEEQLKLRASDRLLLHYAITDDFGVGLAGMILEADGRPLPIRTVALTGSTAAANRSLSGQIALNLVDLPLQQTRRLALQLRARDSRSASLGGPQVGVSRILLLDLDGGVRPYQEQVLAQHTQRLRDALAAARGEVAQAKTSLNTLDQAIKRPADDKTIQDNTRHALTTVEKIDHALETVDSAMQDGFYDGLRQPLRASAGAAVISAAETVSQIPIADDREAQARMTESATADLDRADAALESMAARLDEMHRALEHAVATRELAERQAELAAAFDPHRHHDSLPSPLAESEIAEALDTKPPAESDAAAAAPPAGDDLAQDQMLAKLRLQQAHLVDDLAALIQQMPDANKAAVAQAREQIERLKQEAEALREKQIELAARSEDAKRNAEQWKAAADDLGAQLAALSDARRELLLPRPSVPLGDIAADLESGRLREAAEKIDTVADDLGRQIESLNREQRTEALAEEVRDLLAEHAAPLRRLGEQPTEPEQPSTTDEDSQALKAMADRLDALAAASQEATPLAQQAFSLFNPADDLRASLTPDAAAEENVAVRADTPETAREKAARLEAAMEAAARAARAERLAERVETVADEIRTMENLLHRAQDLSQQMASAVEPRQEALERAAAQVAEQTQAARQRQDALAAEAQEMAEESRRNPVTAAAPMDALQQALMPQPERLTPEVPSPTADARRAEAAAAQARRAADAIDESMAQTQDRADAAVQRAREALEAVAEATNQDMQREARWRLEEAEEARERDRQRVEEAGETADRLKRLAEVLDEVASEHRQVGTQLAEIADDTQRVAEAQALSQQADRRAQAAEREAERLERVQEQLAQQQREMLAEVGDTPAVDARGLAQWEKEKAVPSATESMLDLAASAADLARRQEELAESISELRSTQEQLRQQAAELRQPAAADASAPATAPADAQPSPSVADNERPIIEAFQATEQQMAQLGEAQREMAQEARRIKEQAAELSAGAPPTPMPQPEQPMDRAARALDSAAAPEALAAAQQAAQQQAELAEALAQRATTMPPDQRMAAAMPPSSPMPSPSSPSSPPAPPTPPSPPASSPPSPPTPASPQSQPSSPPPPSESSPQSPQSPPSPPSPPSPSSPSPSDTSSPPTPPPPATPQSPTPPPESDFPDMAMPPAQQAAMDRQATKPEFTGEKLIPETEVIPNIGVDQDGVEWNLGHANERPDHPLPENFDLGKPPVLDDPKMPFNFAGAPDVPVPPVPAAPKKEAMTGPVPYSDPVSMTEPITELPKIIMPDRFPQTFAGEFSDAPIPPPPPEKSSSLAPAPRLTESDLDAAKKEFAELSAIHIDDSPQSSDMGGQAVEELPSEMLFEPGAQYSRGAPGQSSMPGMELGQLAQAENQDQQSPSPAQTPMPSGGGSGGGEDKESPPSPSPSSPSPPQGSPPTPPSGSSSGSSSGSQSSGQPQQPSGSSGQPQQEASPPPPTPPGNQPAGNQPTSMQQGSMAGAGPAGPSMPGSEPASGPASPLSRMDAAHEAQRLREIQESLSPQRHPAASLPGDGGWRDTEPAQSIPAEAVQRLAEQLQQLGGLTPRLLERAQVPAAPTQGLGVLTQESIGQLLPQLASQAQALSQLYGVGTADSDAAAIPADQMAIAEALQYAGRAALSGNPRDAEEAAMRMARTAREARQRAEAMGLRIEPRLSPRAAGDDITEGELRRMGLPVSDWLRLPGELRSEVLQARPAEGPEEYRILIQRYFSDIARDHDTDPD